LPQRWFFDVASARPRLPAGLGNAGKALWRTIVSDVPADAELDARELVLLEQACRAADHESALQAVVKRDGVTAKGSTGQKIVHPALVEARQQRLVILRLLSAIGLDDDTAAAAATSPASRRARRAADARWARRNRLTAIKGGKQ
jgi:P27 family predicted phage terminase small subunit